MTVLSNVLILLAALLAVFAQSAFPACAACLGRNRTCCRP